jgi:uncharacterized protein YfbU (UPF0304 family)
LRYRNTIRGETVATINIRVEDHIRDALEQKAINAGVNLSDYVRDLIRTDVVPVREEREFAPEHLTPIDRRTLSLLHRILARVLPADANDVDGDLEYQLERAKVLEEGYTGEYGMEFAGIDSELSPRDCDRVKDILDMFRIVDHSLRLLREAGEDFDASLAAHLEFEGFDHNDVLESQMSSYVEYLISQDKWTERAPMYESIGGGNSHATMLPSYTRMLGEYRKIMDGRNRGMGRDRFNLSAEELTGIARASFHPNNRSR